MNRQRKVKWWLAAVALVAGLAVLLLIWLLIWGSLPMTGLLALGTAGLLLLIGTTLALAWEAHTAKSELRLCYWIGTMPMVTGLTILLLIWLFEWMWLYLAGLYTVAATALLLPTGTILAFAFAAYTASITRIPPRPVFWPLAKLFVFYAFVGITAMGASGTAFKATSRYDLTIRNDTPEPMRQVQAMCNRVSVRFGQIDPGQTKRRLIWFPGYGPVTLHGTHTGHSFTKVVDSMASCRGWRETNTVRLGEDGVLRTRSRCDEFVEKTAAPIHPPETQSVPAPARSYPD